MVNNKFEYYDTGAVCVKIWEVHLMEYFLTTRLHVL